MHINATFFIQVINFGITYFFLKRILFKPFVQRIKQKESAKTMLQGILKEKDVLLSQLQHEKTQQLEQFRRNAKNFYTIATSAEQEIPEIAMYKKDVSLQEKLIQQTKECLIQRVPHVY